MSTSRIEELRAQLTAVTDAFSLDPPEPTHTASGVERGRALYDERSPEPESSSLGRSRRTRRSTERGIAWAQDVEQSKVLSAKIRRTKERKARRASTSAGTSADELDEGASQAATQSATQDAAEEGDESQYETVAVISCEELLAKLKSKFDFNVTGLSTEEIRDLLEAPDLCENQTTPMETEDNSAEIIVLPPTRVSVGGGFHMTNSATHSTSQSAGIPSTSRKSPNRPAPPAENTDTEPETDDDTPLPQPSTTSSKRVHHTPKSQSPSKRPRILSAENTDTEPETETIPPPYQVPQPLSHASTSTVIPDSQPGSPSPADVAPAHSAPKPPRSYAGSRSFVGSNLTPQASPMNPLRSQNSPAISRSSSRSLGAPITDLGGQPSHNLGGMSRASSTSLGGSIPIFGAQPRTPDAALQPSAPPSQPLPQSKTPSQARPPAVSRTAALPSTTTTHELSETLAGGATSSAPNTGAQVSRSNDRVDMVGDTRERLHRLISVVIGRKELVPEHTSARPQPVHTAPSRHNSGAVATSSTRSRGLAEIMSDDEEGRQAAADRAKGKKVPRRKKKPLTQDIEGRARQVVTVAKLLLFAYVVVFGPYLTRETYLAWAPLIYELAWYMEFPDLPFEPPPGPQSTYEVMVNNLSSLKGCVKLALRPVVQSELKLRRATLTPQDVKHNLEQLRIAYPKHFHCLDREKRTGHYQGKIMGDAIAAGLFGTQHAVGILFHELFNPIPVPTICFILTNLQFCLEEWSTGHFKAADLNTGDMPEKYLCQVTNLKNFRKVADDRLWGLRKEWFKHALVYSGASRANKPESSKFIIDESEFRPDSPKPQSQCLPEAVEPEAEHAQEHEHERDQDSGPAMN